jgi:type IV secretion system protein TrbL
MTQASVFKVAAIGSLASLAFFALPAFAAIPDSGLLNDVTNRFLTQAATWGTRITFYATWIFWVLATISMVWTFGMMALRKADIGELFAEFVKFTVTTGFFWWLLSNGPAMAMAIINSMRKIGADAGGLGGTVLSPSTPISIGFDIVKKAFSGLSWVHPIDNLAIVLVSAAIVVAMAVVAANVLIALVQAYVVAYAGVFILGFGGSRWTSEMAIGYFKAMLGIGMELMTMTLLVGIATSVIDGFYAQLDGSSVYELLLVFCVCVVLALLIDKIPGRVAGLAGGGSGASISAGSVAAAAAMAGAAVASAGAAVAAGVASGAASGAGGMQALTAAFKKASAAESEGGDSGSLMSAAGSAGGAANDSNGGGSGSALASAMGDSSSGGSGGSSTSGATSSSSSDGGNASGRSTSGTESTGAVSSAGAGTSGENSTPGSSGSGGANKQAAAGADGHKAATSSKAGGSGSKAGRIAAGTAVNLAQGAWDVAKGKASEIKQAAQSRIDETTGGKIAAAINARSPTAPPSPDPVAFDGDSLAAGTSSVDDEQEIADFRDGKSESA